MPRQTGYAQASESKTVAGIDLECSFRFVLDEAKPTQPACGLSHPGMRVGVTRTVGNR